MGSIIPGIIGLAGVGAILLIAEYLDRKKIIHGEAARKFVHILTGVFIAFWPFFMSMQAVRYNCLAMILVVYLSRELKLFRSIHKVKRQTWGELLFPLGIGMAATVATAPWIFTVATLQLAVGDGLAAIVGLKWGLKHKYRVLGQLKTYLGSATFFVSSTAILAVAFLLQQNVALNAVTVPLILSLSLLLTAVESIAIYGIDNLLIPLITAVALSMLT